MNKQQLTKWQAFLIIISIPFLLSQKLVWDIVQVFLPEFSSMNIEIIMTTSAVLLSTFIVFLTKDYDCISNWINKFPFIKKVVSFTIQFTARIVSHIIYYIYKIIEICSKNDLGVDESAVKFKQEYNQYPEKIKILFSIMIDCMFLGLIFYGLGLFSGCNFNEIISWVLSIMLFIANTVTIFVMFSITYSGIKNEN